MFKYLLIGLACAAVILGIAGIQCAKRLAAANPMSPELAAAITKARHDLPKFREAVSAGKDKAYFIRASFKEESGRMDLLWLKQVSIAQGGFQGTIDQDPTLVTMVHKGQQTTVKDADVVDWTILREGGTKEGAFTEGLEPNR
jgi:uncharacterized protein YegJ (DUF2314 family)